MALKTWTFKLGEKEISVKAKKDDAERFGQRIKDIYRVPQMTREIWGTIGGETHESTMISLFGPSGVPLADPEGYKQEVADFVAAIPESFTYEAEMKGWAQTASDLIKKHTPVKDTRKTPEQEAARREENRKFEAEQAAKRLERERLEAKQAEDYAVKYRYLTPLRASGKSPWAGGAANIRTELERAFPGVLFSVKSESYSMGSSINVNWTDGPTGKQVKDLTDKYQTASFDGMQDLETSVRTAFNDVFGGAKYVFESRKESDALVLSVANGPDFNLGISTVADIPKDLEYHVRKAVQETAVQPKTAPSVPQEAQGSTSATGIRVSLNAEHNGVEVRFSAKPERSVIDSLKAHGFRWSPRGKLWYAKQSDSRIRFAHDLAGTQPDGGAESGGVDPLTEARDQEGMAFCPSEQEAVA